MIARIATGAALGGVIGFERDIHGRQVGLRTHLIVAMTSATFMVISNHFVSFQNYDSHVEADVSRIAAAVVSGIGFLAGGAILKTGVTLQGVTTAAGLWLVTAIGLACGGGMWIEALAVTFMGLLALTVFRLFEDKNDALVRREVTLVVADAPERLSTMMNVIDAWGAEVSDFDYQKNVTEQLVTVRFKANIPRSIGVPQFVTRLEKEEGIREVRVKGSD